MHFGTGNYNESTARLYTDISYLTCHTELGTDASMFFNTICGYSHPQDYSHLAAAPLTLRSTLLNLIEGETERAKQGRKAHIMAKLNSLVDTTLIDALYKASQAGVKIELNIRGICCLRPGVKGLSEKITVVSIIDRFLEHSRIFYCHHGGDQLLYISSADWMPRNLDRRIELMVPILDPDCHKQALDILRTFFKDNQKARKQYANGRSRRIKPGKQGKAFRAQVELYKNAEKALKEAKKRTPTYFSPHLPSSRNS